ncbi:MAG: sugar phosphate isomerase/epimerase [Acidobacteriota bacterium]|nr:sugar phosphate isomerase/epimerase [Acidobacteriota bacterium]MDE2964341.1 sugar phosphate isomerase/epimerase [Acidobacteriota bacterium]
MQPGISTFLFIEDRLDLDRLAALRRQGFQRVEILALRPHFDYRDSQLGREVASWLLDQESFLHSLHLPHCLEYRPGRIQTPLSIAAVEPHRRTQAVDEARRALEFAERVPCPLAVIHAGALEDGYRPRHLDALYQSLDILVPFAGDRGVRLTLENIPNRLSLERMGRFLREADQTGVGICFDAGHAHLESTPASQITAAGQWILTTHLHDNHGHRDEHLPPFAGTAPWPDILQGLAGSGYDGCLLLESRGGERDFRAALNSAREACDRLEACWETVKKAIEKEE